MPELPEVETVVRALRAPLVGATFAAVNSDWQRQIVTPSVTEMKERLPGKQVLSIDRRAKYLVFTLTGNETLIIHLKMSGHLAVVDQNAPADKYAHVVFSLTDGRELRFRDPRKFGRVYLVKDPAQILAKLGPEPLDDSFTVDVLMARIGNRRRVLKPLLLDQTVIAGIGNIYADEALFTSKIDPRRHSHTLTKDELLRLHGAIRHVLRLGIEREGASINQYVKPDGSKGDMQNAVNVFRRTDFPCYVCGTPIRRIVLGGRSTHFCPVCQQ